MWRELVEKGVEVVKDVARRLRGAAKREFQAEVALEVCGGSPRQAESMFGWSREVVRKGLVEHEHEVELVCHFDQRGRRACEVQSPQLAAAVVQLVSPQSQADPKFQTTLLYTRATGVEVCAALRTIPELAGIHIPSARTCQRLMNRLRFCLRPVQKAKPQAKIPETDAIFSHIGQVREQIKDDPTVLRISIDTKAKVAVGPFCRRGRCRARTPLQAADHDMHPESKIVPFGILEVDSGQLFLSLGLSLETSDFIADGLEDWWLERRAAHAGVRKIVIELDNGPEVQSHRTQFMKRLVDFVDKYQIDLELVYFPPYHSKYNPVERCWSALERHWNGALLLQVNTVVEWAKTMTWRGLRPIVRVVNTAYEKGKRLSKRTFADIEKRLVRSASLSRWSVKIVPLPEPLKEPG
jgi:hypothetical protein